MSSPHQHQTRAAVRDAAQESTTSAIVEEECDEKCGNLRGVIPPSASGGDEQCIRQRCLQDSAKSALTVIRVGDHDKESVDVHTSLDFHASDWTTLHDETFPTPADSMCLPKLSHCINVLTRLAISTKRRQTAKLPSRIGSSRPKKDSCSTNSTKTTNQFNRTEIFPLRMQNKSDNERPPGRWSNAKA
jgi:hypothetical protein